MYVLDTMIVSELRRPTPRSSVIKWFRSVPSEDAFLSVVSVMEIGRGADRVRHTDPELSIRLERWLASMLMDFGDNVLQVTTDIAQRWGLLESQLQRHNVDLAIAATAIVHGFKIVTRNVRDFAPTGVEILNPFD
jgi:predicted nucleic acid-binding protein